MRRLQLCAITALSVLVAAIGIAACGGDDDEEATGGSESVKVGFVTKYPIEFYFAMQEGAKRADAADDGAEVMLDAGKSDTDVEGQIRIVETMVAQGVDAIAITPVGEQVQPAIEKAANEGVKVILVDNDLPDFSNKTAFVGTDNLKGGQLAGQYMADQLKPGNSVAILRGVNGNPAHDARADGAKEALEGAGFEVVEELPTDCLREKGQAATEDVLTAHRDLKGVYAICGSPALGAAQAAKDADLLIVGFDASPEEVEAIMKGVEDASVAQFPGKMGEVAVEQAIKAARGEKIPNVVDTGTEIVDKQNASEFTEYR